MKKETTTKTFIDIKVNGIVSDVNAVLDSLIKERVCVSTSYSIEDREKRLQELDDTIHGLYAVKKHLGRLMKR